MGNRHNEQALADTLREILPRFASVAAGEERHLHGTDDDPWWECHDCVQSLSIWLASRGTLIPAAATNAQLADAIAVSASGNGRILLHNLRTCLDAIAKGEPMLDERKVQPSA